MKNTQEKSLEEIVDHVFHAYYRDPKPTWAARALEHAIESGLLEKEKPIVYLFTRIATEDSAVQKAFQEHATDNAKYKTFVDALLEMLRRSNPSSVLEEPIQTPDILDYLWSEFAATGNPVVIERMIGVLDWDDVVRNCLQEWLAGLSPEDLASAQYQEDRKRLVDLGFPVEGMEVQGKLDLDLYTAFLIRDGELKFSLFPFEVPYESALRLGIKSAALWSLRSFSARDDLVARLCKEASRASGGAGRTLLLPDT